MSANICEDFVLAIRWTETRAKNWRIRFRHTNWWNWGLLQAFHQARRHRHHSHQPKLRWAHSSCDRRTHLTVASCFGNSLERPPIRRIQGLDFETCQGLYNRNQSFSTKIQFSYPLLYLLFHRECSTQKIWSAKYRLFATFYSISVC